MPQYLEPRSLIMLALLLSMGGVGAHEGTGPPWLLKAGERLYREGVDLDGEPLRATWPGGVTLRPGQAACGTCHRPSGMGGIEGQTVVPPVAGDLLFQRGSGTVQPFGTTFSRRAWRPAYTDTTLARALRNGVDPAGRPLVAPMPRYDLSSAQAAALAAYLKSLAYAPPPGVTAEELHFATVVAGPVPEARRRALMEVLSAFGDSQRGETRRVPRADGNGFWPSTSDGGARTWRLHLWELRGAPADWPRQLKAHYRQRPVFALLGGVTEGPWQPIHRFCEAQALPCLFPTTDLPAGHGIHSFHFSGGLPLEAEALAAYLSRGSTPSVLQLVDEDPGSRTAARAFRAAWVRRGGAVRERRWAEWVAGTIPAEQLPATLVLWTRDADLNALAPWAGHVERLFVSSSLLGELPAAPTPLAEKSYALHRFALPERREQQLSRFNLWRRVKGIAPGDERVQSEAYFAATITADALRRIGNRISRAHFLEQIEEMVDNVTVHSPYPSLSLGPGQRFASKGVYVVTLTPADRPVAMRNAWVIP